MHLHAEIWFSEKPEDIEGAVHQAMTPFCEEDGDNEAGWWDWFQIGGRWKGAHVPGYDADKDPDHLKTCDLCHGTGKRIDSVGRAARIEDPTYGCNGCNSTGTMVTWPTQWESHEKDVIAVEDASDKLTCATLLIVRKGQDALVFQDDDWDTEGAERKTVKELLKENGCEGGILVTVDYHS